MREVGTGKALRFLGTSLLNSPDVTFNRGPDTGQYGELGLIWTDETTTSLTPVSVLPHLEYLQETRSSIKHVFSNARYNSNSTVVKLSS